MTVTPDSLTISLADISQTALLVAGGALAALVLLMILLLVRSAGMRRQQAEEADLRGMESEARMAELLKIQAEMQGRISTMAEVFGTRQAELNQAIGQRLDGMSQRVSSTTAASDAPRRP